MASQKKQRKCQQATPAKIVSAERIARAMELRKGGATYEMIGVDLGVSTPRAFEIVNDALKALVTEPAEKVRKLEIERLDHMLSVIWPTATNAMSEVTTVDASLLEMILKAQIEHEPIADAKTETDMIRFADAGETVTNRDDVTKRTASRNGSDPVTKPPDVTKRLESVALLRP